MPMAEWELTGLPLKLEYQCRFPWQENYRALDPLP
jgi:hypothetical protein